MKAEKESCPTTKSRGRQKTGATDFGVIRIYKEATMPQSNVMKKVSNDIKTHGWHVLSVFCKDLPNFSYTIGFTETLNHPEIVISGLDSKLAHLLLNDIGNLI